MRVYPLLITFFCHCSKLITCGAITLSDRNRSRLRRGSLTTPLPPAVGTNTVTTSTRLRPTPAALAAICPSGRNRALPRAGPALVPTTGALRAQMPLLAAHHASHHITIFHNVPLPLTIRTNHSRAFVPSVPCLSTIVACETKVLALSGSGASRLRSSSAAQQSEVADRFLRHGSRRRAERAQQGGSAGSQRSGGTSCTAKGQPAKPTTPHSP